MEMETVPPAVKRYLVWSSPLVEWVQIVIMHQHNATVKHTQEISIVVVLKSLAV